MHTSCSFTHVLCCSSFVVRSNLCKNNFWVENIRSFFFFFFAGRCFVYVWVPAFAPVCLHPCVCIREGRPAGSVVVGEGEEPPDGQLWQRGQLWSKAQDEEEEGGGRREGRAAGHPEERGGEAGLQNGGPGNDGVLRPTVGPFKNQEITPASLLPAHWSDRLEYSPQAEICKC